MLCCCCWFRFCYWHSCCLLDTEKDNCRTCFATKDHIFCVRTLNTCLCKGMHGVSWRRPFGQLTLLLQKFPLNELNAEKYANKHRKIYFKCWRIGVAYALVSQRCVRWKRICFIVIWGYQKLPKGICCIIEKFFWELIRANILVVWSLFAHITPNLTLSWVAIVVSWVWVEYDIWVELS